VGLAGSQQGGSFRKEEQLSCSEATCKAVHYPGQHDSYRFQQQKTAWETKPSCDAVSFYPVNSTLPLNDHLYMSLQITPWGQNSFLQLNK